jgi:hypothetical protein
LTIVNPTEPQDVLIASADESTASNVECPLAQTPPPKTAENLQWHYLYLMESPSISARTLISTAAPLLIDSAHLAHLKQYTQKIVANPTPKEFLVEEWDL